MERALRLIRKGEAGVSVPYWYPDCEIVMRIIELLGYAGVGHHIRLLCRTSPLSDTGHLIGLKPYKIEEMAGWSGEPGAFIKAMLESEALYQDTAGTFIVRGWSEWGLSPAGKRRQVIGPLAVVADPIDSEEFVEVTERQGREPPVPKRNRANAAKRAAKMLERNNPAPFSEKEVQKLVKAGLTVNGVPVLPQTAAVFTDGKVGKVEGQEKDRLLQFLESWNQIALKKGLQTVRRLPPDRHEALNERLSDPTWGWVDALHYIDKRLPDIADVQNKKVKRHFLQGDGRSHWIGDLAWFILPDTVVNLMSGKFDRLRPGQMPAVDVEWKQSEAAIQALAEATSEPPGDDQ